MTDTHHPGLITLGNAPRLADLDNPDALMPASVGIFCDDCGTEHVADYLVPPDSTGPERFEIARRHLRDVGWSCTEGEDLCPDCSRAVACKTPIEALADVEAFCDNLPGEGDAIRAYVRGGKDYRLTDADLRAVIAIAKFALSPGIPAADYPGVWAELTGYVQAHAEDGDPIDAKNLLAYLRELRRKALAPVREWMASVEAGATGDFEDC